MKNYLISETISDIVGSVYEGRTRRIKDYDRDDTGIGDWHLV